MASGNGESRRLIHRLISSRCFACDSARHGEISKGNVWNFRRTCSMQSSQVWCHGSCTTNEFTCWSGGMASIGTMDPMTWECSNRATPIGVGVRRSGPSANAGLKATHTFTAHSRRGGHASGARSRHGPTTVVEVTDGETIAPACFDWARGHVSVGNKSERQTCIAPSDQKVQT